MINISARELEILILISEEYSNKEIAKELNIKLGTVESHRKNLFRKLRVRNMAGLINQAYQLGVLKVGKRRNKL